MTFSDFAAWAIIILAGQELFCAVKSDPTGKYTNRINISVALTLTAWYAWAIYWIGTHGL